MKQSIKDILIKHGASKFQNVKPECDWETDKCILRGRNHKKAVNEVLNHLDEDNELKFLPIPFMFPTNTTISYSENGIHKQLKITK